MTSYRAAVAASAGPFTGVVGVDVAVLPNMSPTHEETFRASRAAIAEVGGQLAHLAIVAREGGRTLMVMPKACSILQPGMRVTLDPARCRVIVHSEGVP